MWTARASSQAVRPLRVTMLLENNPYPQDVRVRAEARSLARAGYRVRVIAPRANGEPPREMVDDVAVERYRLPLVHSGSSRRMLLEYVIAHAQLYWRGILALARGADVIHAHNPPDTLFPLGLLGRAVGCKFVFDQHDVFPELVTERYPNRMLATVARRAQGMSVRAAHLVITTNGSQRTAVLGRTARSQDDVIIVRNGLSSAWLQREVEHRRGALRDPRLVYVGLLEEQDGVDALPMILSMLVKRPGMEGARLTVVGDGSRSHLLRAKVTELGLDGQVHFTGLVSHDRALAAIATADICLDVAPCTEFNHQTTMVKIIEYLTLGKPVVSFPLEETIALGGDAIAYATCNDVGSFAARIATLAESDSLRLELIARARKLAGSLVWERSAEALLKGYRMLEGEN